jgi:hypothetical protein
MQISEKEKNIPETVTPSNTENTSPEALQKKTRKNNGVEKIHGVK